jgi:hypothetical protein
MIYLMVATIKENIRRRGLNLGSEKTGFNQCLDQNMKEGLNKVQTLIKHSERRRGRDLKWGRMEHWSSGPNSYLHQTSQS